MATEVDTRFFQRLPLGRGPGGRVFGLQPASGECHIAGPGITRPAGSLDKEQLLAAVFFFPKDQRNRSASESAPEWYFLRSQLADPGFTGHGNLSSGK